MARTYYDVFVTDTHVEYHVSHIKQEVMDRQAMSRRIDFSKATDVKAMAEAIVRYHDEAQWLESQRVFSHPKRG